jgi:hypothetical protein
MVCAVVSTSHSSSVVLQILRAKAHSKAALEVGGGLGCWQLGGTEQGGDQIKGAPRKCTGRNLASERQPRPLALLLARPASQVLLLAPSVAS